MARKWKLQWAYTTEETAEAAQAYDYFRMDDRNVLIYSARANSLFTPADDSFLKTLTPDEVEWFSDCITAVNAQRAKKMSKQSFQNDLDFMEALERELAVEMDRFMKEGGEPLVCDSTPEGNN